MRLRGVAWDIDGTLVDSEPLHLRVLIDVCLSHGLDLRDDPVDRFLGVHMQDVWAALAPDLPKGLSGAAWMEAIQNSYVARAQELCQIPDAVAVIRALAQAGVPQVAVSNSGRQVVDANLAALGVAELLTTSISLDDVRNGKPDPEPYVRGARALGLPPAQVLAVEDSATGVLSALAAGLAVAALGLPQPGAQEISGLRDIPPMLGVGWA
ncbi:HAD family phosphatase [Salipiger sp. 1_MG-2023]|uniref:HAD family hydrolase n=1 Tax=Salipiger sp. 1_MG-2023 TaxID=3062665 RepID=UPI0026E2B411|nr:HAD family phosphatase [Salipiger sp. 1_MG-2023]MDO6584669.1 HAD family phosphatase [Salipiger sp. 1_MG-2023]